MLVQRNFLLGQRSRPAPIDSVGSSNKSLNNIPLVPKKNAPALGVPSFCRFPEDHLRRCHGFVRAVVFMRALTVVCVFFPSICTTFDFFFSEIMLRVLALITFLTEVPCQTSCPDAPLQTAWATTTGRCLL